MATTSTLRACVLATLWGLGVGWAPDAQGTPDRQRSCSSGVWPIEPATKQTCDLWLEAGDVLHLLVIQLGADLVTTVYGPRRERLLQVDYPGVRPGTEEPLWLVAPATGRYRVELEASHDGVAGGRYRLVLQPPRPADRTDTTRGAGTAAFVRGRALLRAARRESRPPADPSWEQAARNPRGSESCLAGGRGCGTGRVCLGGIGDGPCRASAA